MADYITPENLLYTKSHEWIKIEDSIATIGITDFAQKELSDIVYVEYILEIDDNINKEDAFCTIEAVKTAEDIISPITGTIVEINENLPDDPALINNSPFEKGWIIKIKTENINKEDFLDAQKYIKLVEESSH